VTDTLDQQAADTAKRLEDTAARIHDEIDTLARLLAKMRGLCFVTPSELDRIERLRKAAKRVDLLATIGSLQPHTPEALDAVAELEEALKE
jgi:methylphosphotriester-DNA--protein-cysteine methyltransferase